ncbi:histidine phosphatase family protein [Bacillus idriensis]|uniref:Histidine phosphatase family protein n=1 Tax=Metabacillus idriensis TaxID=324768 RepID=A0A6I2MHJ6_9BACI|nr:histidine phosphatase family protein [Metabacillus idriensis]MRX56602.1 histidine phosphatase family protein [Metabacillus idriensis]
MTNVCLVRHGETEWNRLGKLQGRTDIPLNLQGKLQAQECRKYLRDFEYEIVISSPLKRALETAQIINEGEKSQVLVMKEFIERDYGDAEGMTIEERQLAFPDKNYPNQESREFLNERITNGLTKINQDYSDSNIVLVAPGAVINAILAHISDGEIGSGKTKLINACVSSIEFIEEKWRVNHYNQITHLSKYSEKGNL